MNNLSFYLLNTEETFTTSTRITTVIEEDLNGDPFIDKIVPIIRAYSSKLSTVLGRTTDQYYTRQLEKDDDAQDSAFIGLRDYCKAFMNAPEEDMKEAAIKLVELFKAKGWSLWSEGYTVQSAKQHSLISELEKEEYQNALKTILGLSWFENLKTKSEAFEKTNQEKIDAEAGKESPLVGETKKTIIKYLEPLLSYVNIMAEMNEVDFELASKKIDDIITNAMALAKARKTRKNNTNDLE
jgi:hypothetical protein